MKNKFFLASTLVILLLVFSYAFFSLPSYSGKVELLNLSGQEVSKIEVIVSHQDFSFTDFPNGGVRKFSYSVDGDSSYKVKVKFKMGSWLEEDIGYVTRGFDFNDRLVIEADNIRLERLSP